MRIYRIIIASVEYHGTGSINEREFVMHLLFQTYHLLKVTKGSIWVCLCRNEATALFIVWSLCFPNTILYCIENFSKLLNKICSCAEALYQGQEEQHPSTHKTQHKCIIEVFYKYLLWSNREMFYLEGIMVVWQHLTYNNVFDIIDLLFF